MHLAANCPAASLLLGLLPGLCGSAWACHDAGIDAAIHVGPGSRYTTIADGIQAARQHHVHRLVVAAGSYREDAALDSDDNHLAIVGNGTVILTGSMTIAGADAIAVSGLHFIGNGSNVAVTATGSRRISIWACNFTNVGQAVLLDGTSGSTVAGNEVRTATASAIEARNGAGHDTIENNAIEGDGATDTVGAIWLHGTDHARISHNRIRTTSGAAISLMDFGAPGTTATQNTAAAVTYNDLEDVDQRSQDSGAIYILGRSQLPDMAATVTGNFISGAGSAGAHAVGIYLDDNASGVVVSRNIVSAGLTMSDVFEIHGGSNVTIARNIFDLGAGMAAGGLFQQDEADQQPQGNFRQLQNDRVSFNLYGASSITPHDPVFADLTGGIGAILVQHNDYWNFAGAALSATGSGAAGDTAPVFVRPAPLLASFLQAYGRWHGGGIGFDPIDVSAIGPQPACGPDTVPP